MTIVEALAMLKTSADEISDACEKASLLFRIGEDVRATALLQKIHVTTETLQTAAWAVLEDVVEEKIE